MWFYFVFLIVATIAFFGIAMIVVRKFPQLSRIDTSIIPEERTLQKKKEIIKERAVRQSVALFRPLFTWFGQKIFAIRMRFRTLYRRLLDMEAQIHNQKPLSSEEREEKIKSSIIAAEKAVEEGEESVAEKRYIEAIALDPRRKEAYIGLARVYETNRRFYEAREMYEFIRRLLNRLGGATVSEKGEIEVALGEVCLAMDDYHAAHVSFERALTFEPANPRYLDLLLETCILEGAKEKAIELLARMHDANPENQKLRELSDKVAAMKE